MNDLGNCPTQPRHDGFWPGRLWSLSDMLKVTAQHYINLGRQIADCEAIFAFTDADDKNPAEEKTEEQKSRLSYHLEAMRQECGKIGLPVSRALLVSLKGNQPQTGREFDLVVQAIWAELEDKLFLFVPSHQTPYYENDRLSAATALAFPTVAKELLRAGNCYALDEPTAAVLHAMRGAEICVHVLAKALNVTFSGPTELQDWQAILNQVAGKIKEIGGKPRSHERNADLEFFTHAAAQLQFFKDGWRIRAAHPGDFYSPSQAKQAIDHVKELTEILEKRLSEGSPRPS